MSKQQDRNSEEFFSTSEVFKVVISAVSFLADLVTVAIFLSGFTGFPQPSLLEPTSFHLVLVILLFVLVLTGLVSLLGGLAQRYKRLNEEDLKWKYEIERKRYTKHQIRLRRSSSEVEDLIYRQINKLGLVVGWIGFLPYAAWSTFFGSIIRAALVKIARDPSANGLITATVVMLVLLILLLYSIPLEIAKSIVRNLFHVL